jgi:hypothetical protein
MIDHAPAREAVILRLLLDDLGWRSAEMLKTYDHAVTNSELKELMAASVRQMLQDAPYDSASLAALLRRGVHPGPTSSADDGQSNAPILSDEARQMLAWIEALDEE